MKREAWAHEFQGFFFSEGNSVHNSIQGFQSYNVRATFQGWQLIRALEQQAGLQETLSEKVSYLGIKIVPDTRATEGLRTYTHTHTRATGKEISTQVEEV